MEKTEIKAIGDYLKIVAFNDDVPGKS